MRSLGNESILTLEDLDLIPEQFQSRSSGAQAKCMLFAAYLQSAYCRVFWMDSLCILGVVLPTKAGKHKKEVKSAFTQYCPAPLVCHIAAMFYLLFLA